LQEELTIEKEKNKKLQQDRRVIRVTGPGGFPVYAERHFHYATPSRVEPDARFLKIQNSTGNLVGPGVASCSIQDLDACEVHIGGKETLVLGECHDIDGVDSIGYGDASFCYNFHPLGNDRYRTCVFIDFSPVPNREYPFTRTPQDYRNEKIEYLRFERVSSRGTLSTTVNLQ